MPTFDLEHGARESGFTHIAGVDEVGRGPLAGPLFAAAVYLDESAPFEGLNDSKTLTEKKREVLYARLVESKSVVWSLASVDAGRIDRINIYEATREAMEAALGGLTPTPDLALVDGRPFRSFKFPHRGVVKGDQLSYSIAAASVIAKVTRDRLMVKLDDIYPQYGFKKHKGYGTREHLEALRRHGSCPIHRRSFAPLAQASLPFG